MKSGTMGQRILSMFARCVFLFAVFQSRCTCSAMDSFGIGAMLSSQENENFFQEAVKKINTDSSVLRTERLNATSHVLSPNPIRSALDVCEKLIAKGVSVVIVSHPKDEVSPPISVSYACSFYQIPVIGISARETIFSDKVKLSV